MSVREGAPGCADAGGGLWAERDSFEGGGESHPFEETGFLDGEGAASRGADGVEDHEVAEGARDAEARGDGARVGGWFGESEVVIEGVNDGSAAGGLAAEHAREAWIVEPAEGGEFGEGLPHADEAGSAAGGVEDGVGEGPSALLGEFEAHGFLAFDAVWLSEGAHVEPAHALGALSDDGGAVVDEAVDEEDAGAEEEGFESVDDGSVVRHEDEALDGGAGAVGGECAPGVSGGGDGEAGDAEFAGHGDGHGHASGLEGAGGEVRFVLDEEVGQAECCAEAWAGEEGGGFFAERNDGGFALEGEKFAAAPHGGGACAQVVTGDGAGDGGEVVADPEGAVFVGGVELACGEAGAIDGGFEVGDEVHGEKVPRWGGGRHYDAADRRGNEVAP